MDLRQLKSFCFVAEHGTIKEAAKRCFRTSAAISLQMKALEKELDVKLLESTGKRFILTPAGEAFYQDIQRVLELTEAAVEKAKTRSGDFAGRISLTAPACLRSFYLPAIARFRSAYPSIRLTILARSHQDAPSTVYSGVADLAMGLFQQSFEDLEEISLVAPRLTLVIPADYHEPRLARRVLLQELSRHPLVVLQPSTTTRRLIDSAFRGANLPLRIGMEASTCPEVKRYVLNKLGLGIVHDICIEPEDHNLFRFLNVEKLFPHPQAKLLYRRSKRKTVAETKLIEFLRAMSA